jgi:hypothetical protein
MCGMSGANVPGHRHEQAPPDTNATSVRRVAQYRLPEDRLSFWTGKYPTAGPVMAFMCEDAVESPCTAASRMSGKAIELVGPVPLPWGRHCRL